MNLFNFCPSCGAPQPELRAKSVFCPECQFEYFHNVAATAGVLFYQGSQLLWVTRAREPARGLLDLPGGFVDPRESIEQSLVRELDEELGLALDPNTLRYVCSADNRYLYAGTLYHTADSLFIAPLSAQVMLSPADDVAAATWIEQSQLMVEQIAFGSIRRALPKLLEAVQQAQA